MLLQIAFTVVTARNLGIKTSFVQASLFHDFLGRSKPLRAPCEVIGRGEMIITENMDLDTSKGLHGQLWLGDFDPLGIF